jgi:hypothetical protein
MSSEETTYWPEPGQTFDPDIALDTLRELHAGGGPEDFEQAMALILGLDTHIQNGGSLPVDWRFDTLVGKERDDGRED